MWCLGNFKIHFSHTPTDLATSVHLPESACVRACVLNGSKSCRTRPPTRRRCGRCDRFGARSRAPPGMVKGWERVRVGDKARAHGEFVFCPCLLEGGLELGIVVAAGRGELRLHARLESGLCLGHELGAHVVPRRVVGRGDRHRRVREIADWKSARAKKVSGVGRVGGVGG